jgi:hypothetical protein
MISEELNISKRDYHEILSEELGKTKLNTTAK